MLGQFGFGGLPLLDPALFDELPLLAPLLPFGMIAPPECRTAFVVFLFHRQSACFRSGSLKKRRQLRSSSGTRGCIGYGGYHLAGSLAQLSFLVSEAGFTDFGKRQNSHRRDHLPLHIGDHLFKPPDLLTERFFVGPAVDLKLKRLKDIGQAINVDTQ